MNLEILEVLFRCIIMPILAIGIILGLMLGLIAMLEILTGTNPGSKDSLLYPFFQEGAIFGPDSDISHKP